MSLRSNTTPGKGLGDACVRALGTLRHTLKKMVKLDLNSSTSRSSEAGSTASGICQGRIWARVVFHMHSSVFFTFRYNESFWIIFSGNFRRPNFTHFRSFQLFFLKIPAIFLIFMIFPEMFCI